MGAPGNSTNNWGVLGSWLEENQWHLQCDDGAWEGHTADFDYSTSHASLKIVIARLRIIKAIAIRKGLDVILRMPGAKATELFTHTNPAAKIMYSAREYTDDTIDLQLTSNCLLA